MADAGNSRRDAKGRLGGRKAVVKLLQSFGYKHDRHTVFGDVMETMAIAISNAVDRGQFGPREARYMEIVKRYAREELDVFARILAEVVLELEAGHDDVMGSVFGELDLGNSAAGQFFTPYEVARLMARVTIGDGSEARSLIEQNGFVSVLEPAVGAGGMVIALAEALSEVGINYQQHMHVTAVDVDARAAHMAYVQFSLLHIPAVVVVGNSITLEQRGCWYTPAHVLGGWEYRKRERGELVSVPVEPAAEAIRRPFGTGQLRLL